MLLKTTKGNALTTTGCRDDVLVQCARNCRSCLLVLVGCAGRFGWQALQELSLWRGVKEAHRNDATRCHRQGIVRQMCTWDTLQNTPLPARARRAVPPRYPARWRRCCGEPVGVGFLPNHNAGKSNMRQKPLQLSHTCQSRQRESAHKQQNSPTTSSASKAE
jgi:hypothetical protein